MRTRTTGIEPAYYLFNGTKVPLSPVTKGFIIDSSRKPCSCRHETDTFASGFGAQTSAGTYELHNYNFAQDGTYGTLLAEGLDKTRLSLNWDKLPTSNGLSLLNTIAEIDDNISLFTLNFYKNLSYGKFKWGIMPFISDLKKLMKYIQKQTKGFDSNKVRYEDERSCLVTRKSVLMPDTALVDISINVKQRYSGYISYPDGSGVSQLLDQLGVHPDINVAWEAIPLSFMVDWFLPVGNYLKSIHQSGWVRSVTFNGYHTVKATGSLTLVGHRPPVIKSGSLVQNRTYFHRNIVVNQFLNLENPATSIDSAVSKSFSDSKTSVETMFNTLYLLYSKKR